MKQSIGLHPRLRVDSGPVTAVGQAGGVLLTETVRAARLGDALSGELGRWRSPWARHDPGKVLVDLAITLALGGEPCYLAIKVTQKM